MAAKEEHTTKTLVRRCLVFVLKEKKAKKLDKSDDKDVHETPTGKELFDQWVDANKDCFWNPHLEESIRNLKYVGYLQPYTILVSGRDIYLDTVRNAWGRRSLRAPQNLVLHRVGKSSNTHCSLITYILILSLLHPTPLTD